MKSYLNMALDIMECVIADAITRWPTLQGSLEKDLSYLRRAIEQRGLGFLTLTLPAFGKHFDKCLSSGYLSQEGVPQGIPFKRGKPVLLQGLLSQVFDDCNVLRPQPCIDSVLFLRQICYQFKKLRLDCSPQAVKETLDEFFKVERGLPPSHADTWDSDIPCWKERQGHPLWGVPETHPGQYRLEGLTASDPRDRAPLPWHTLRQLCRRVVSELGTPCWWSIRPKHGPGSVSDGLRHGSKYSFPTWPRKLEVWFPYDWHGSGLLDNPGPFPNDREPASRLITVPKTQKGPRIICSEPTAHQWIQQGIWRWLETSVGNSLLSRSISFRSQERSRELALRASIDGSLATIDLSQASDRLSTRLVEYVFQGSEILDGLHACRSRAIEQTISQDHPKMVLTRKFAPMGSACTFPIQSIVFAILAIWSTKLAEGTEEDLSDLPLVADAVRVFGDDIILPTHAVETIKLVLHECGLKVNTDKSFSEGFFRESCGMDAFMGYDVTPAYILEPYDGSPSSMAATVEASNNFHKKGFWITANAIAGQIPLKERKLLRVSGPDDGTFGLFSFGGTDTSHLRDGWDSDLHQRYTRHLVVDSRTTKDRGEGHSDLSQYFFEKPRPDVVWSAGTVRRVTLRKRVARAYR